jgi:O-antigen ligase
MHLPIDKNLYSGHLYLIFLISMCLLPFSTGTGGGSVVVTYALPFQAILCVLIIGNFIVRKERINYPDELKLATFCALLHAFSIFISSLMNQNLAVSFARSIFDLFGFVIFLYITSTASVRKDATLAYNKISLIFVLSGFILSLYFIANFLLAIQENSLEQVLLERENGGLMSLPWGASNTIAACLMMAFYLALDRAFNMKSLKSNDRIITFFIMLTIVAAIIITQSRNVIITLMLGMVFIGILTKNTKSMLVFFTLLVIIFTLVMSFYGQDLDTIFAARVGDGAEDVGGFNGRTTVWAISIDYFFKHPFEPVGYFGMLGYFDHTGHNVFITTLLDQGVLGLFAYVLFVINNFSFCIKKIFSKLFSFTTRIRMTFYLIAMLSILIQLQFEDSNFTAPNITYKWIFLALMYLSPYCDVPDRNQALAEQ